MPTHACESPLRMTRIAFSLTSFLVLSACASAAPNTWMTVAPTAYQLPTPYVQEIAADEPLGHWRMDGDADGALLSEPDAGLRFDGARQMALRADDFGGRAFGVECWARDLDRGTIFSYATARRPDALALTCLDDEFTITLQGDARRTGVPCASPGWRHLALTWSQESRRLRLMIQSAVAWEGFAQADALPTQGSFVVGQGQGCPRGCFQDGLIGALDELVLYDQPLAPSRARSHIAVAMGEINPSKIDAALPARLQPQFGHADHIQQIAHSPDGRLMASADANALIKLWDVETGALIRDLRFHPAEQRTPTFIPMAFSPDGRTLAVGGYDWRVKIWDVQTGQLRHTLSLHKRFVVGLRFSPDGRSLASLGADLMLHLWDAQTGQLKHDLSLLKREQRYKQGFGSSYYEPYPTAMAFSPDSGLLAYVLQTEEVRLVDVRSGVHLGDRSADDSTLDTGLDAPDSVTGRPPRITTLMFTPGGQALATSHADGQVRLWSLDRAATTPSGVLSLRHQLSHPSAVGPLAFSDDGAALAIADETPQVQVWDVATGQRRHTFPTETVTIALHFDPDGDTLRGLQYSRDIHRWSLDQRAARSTLSMPWRGELRVCVPNNDWSRLGSGLVDGTVEIHETTQGTREHRQDLRPTDVRQLTFSRDASRLIVAKNDGVAAWDTDTGALINNLSMGPNVYSNIASSPDGRTIAIDGVEGLNDIGGVWLIDTDTGTLRHTLAGHQDRITGLLFSPNGAHLTSISRDGTAAIWDVQTGTLRHTLNLGEQGLAGAYSPDGRWLATSSGEGVVKLWDAQTGQLQHTLTGHTQMVMTLAFHPDGTQLATSGWDHEVRVWRLPDGRPRHLFQGHTGTVYHLTWHPKREVLVSGSDDGTARVWDVDAGRNLSVLSRHAASLKATVFQPAGDVLMTAGSDGSVKQWDTRRWTLLNEFNADGVRALATSPDGRLVASGSNDGVVKLQHIASGRGVSLLSSASRWLTHSDDNFFDASADGAALAAMVQGRRVFGVEQLALTKNRPDILVKRLGAINHRPPESCAPSWRQGLDLLQLTPEDIARRHATLDLLREHYHARYLKRLELAGVSEAQVARLNTDLPQARILQVVPPGSTNQDEAPEAGSDQALLSLSLKDRRGLRSYQLYVNDVPVFRTPRAIEGRQHTDEVAVTLSHGDNQIEVSALNDQGQESRRARVRIRHERAQPGDLYFVGFGVSDYSHNDQIPDLQFAHQDVLDLAATFQAGADHHRAVHVTTLTDAQVTPQAIDAVRDVLSRVTVHDTLVLFVAGHGVRDQDAAHTYYYLPHGARLDDLAGSAVPFDAIETLLFNTAARRKLFLMDTCQSGEVDETLTAGAALEDRGRGLRARAVPMGTRSAKAFGAPAATSAPPRLTPGQLNRDRFIYADLARRSGAIVFASSRGHEYSLEGAEYANGVFTEAILQALRSRRADTDEDRALSAAELRAYVSRAVPRLTSGRQHPSVTRDNLTQRFTLPIVIDDAEMPDDAGDFIIPQDDDLNWD